MGPNSHWLSEYIKINTKEAFTTNTYPWKLFKIVQFKLAHKNTEYVLEEIRIISKIMEINSYMLYAFLLFRQLITGIDTKKMFVARLNRSHFDVTLWDPLNFEDLNIVPGVGFHQKSLNIR